MPRYLYRCSVCPGVFESQTRTSQLSCRHSGCPGTAKQALGVVTYPALRP
jgi:hypothetical protein